MKEMKEGINTNKLLPHMFSQYSIPSCQKRTKTTVETLSQIAKNAVSEQIHMHWNGRNFAGIRPFCPRLISTRCPFNLAFDAAVREGAGRSRKPSRAGETNASRTGRTAESWGDRESSAPVAGTRAVSAARRRKLALTKALFINHVP